MIKLSQISLNPLNRSELFTTYEYNIGERYSALYINNFDDIITIYDGIMHIKKMSVEIELQNYTIGEICNILISHGIDASCFPGTGNIPAILLVNFSNTSLVETKLEISPLDSQLIKSKSLINNTLDDYWNNVNTEVVYTGIDSISIHNNKIYFDFDDNDKTLVTKHTAKRFILHITDMNIIKEYDNIRKIPQSRIALIEANKNIKGDDNAGYKI